MLASDSGYDRIIRDPPRGNRTLIFSHSRFQSRIRWRHDKIAPRRSTVEESGAASESRIAIEIRRNQPAEVRALANHGRWLAEWRRRIGIIARKSHDDRSIGLENRALI